LHYRRSKSKVIFDILNMSFLIGLSIACIFPIIHVLAMSLSSKTAVDSGFVTLFPIDFTLDSYKFVIAKKEFFAAFLVTLKRLLLGVPLNLVLAILSAYVLSKSNKEFPKRTVFAWIFMFTMLFSGGLIPTFVLIDQLDLIDKIWALVLPGAVPVYYVVLLLNFFRGIPKDFEDAAFIDGAGHFRILWSIFIPLSLPSIATITLFSMVDHWNAWFDGIIYMNRPEHYPIQSYLRTLFVDEDVLAKVMIDAQNLDNISNRTQTAAQIFVATVPILLVYPLLQRYFVTGLTLGGIKE